MKDKIMPFSALEATIKNPDAVTHSVFAPDNLAKFISRTIDTLVNIENRDNLCFHLIHFNYPELDRTNEYLQQQNSGWRIAELHVIKRQLEGRSHDENLIDTRSVVILRRVGLADLVGNEKSTPSPYVPPASLQPGPIARALSTFVDASSSEAIAQALSTPINTLPPKQPQAYCAPDSKEKGTAAAVRRKERELLARVIKREKDAE